MQYQVEELSQVKRTINVQAPVEEVNAALAATIAIYKRSADLDGFRKGKVPSSIIEGKFKKQITSEATTDLVNVHINEIMAELKIKPVSRIDFDGKELIKDEPFEYKMHFEVMPLFAAPNFVGMEVEQEEATVDEAEVQAVFDRIRNQLAELAPVDEDRSPVDGDVAVISFTASKDGVPLPEYRGDNFELMLGENQALPQFEELIKTLTKGELKAADITMPDDFLNPELAGKAITFEVRLNGLKQKVLPELNDELAKKAGPFETVDKMREAIHGSYLESRKQLNKSQAQKKLLDSLIAQVEYPLPDALVDQHAQRMVNELRYKLEQRGKNLESTGRTEAELMTEYRQDAEPLARAEVFLWNVAQQENITVSEQEVDFYFRQAAARTGENYVELKTFHEQNNLMPGVVDKLIADKAMEYMYGKVSIKMVPPAAKAETQA
jgi:trigger factor